MKIIVMTILATSALAVTIPASSGAQTLEGYKVLTPKDIKWFPSPVHPGTGVESTILYGHPRKKGPFAFRIKMPKGYLYAPHFNQPSVKVVTVLSGTVLHGVGKTADKNKTVPLPAGSVEIIPAGMVTYAFFDEDTVAQIHAVGPWSTTYINPTDDPRTKTKSSASKTP